MVAATLCRPPRGPASRFSTSGGAGGFMASRKRKRCRGRRRAGPGPRAAQLRTRRSSLPARRSMPVRRSPQAFSSSMRLISSTAPFVGTRRPCAPARVPVAPSGAGRGRSGPARSRPTDRRSPSASRSVSAPPGAARAARPACRGGAVRHRAHAFDGGLALAVLGDNIDEAAVSAAPRRCTGGREDHLVGDREAGLADREVQAPMPGKRLNSTSGNRRWRCARR